MTSSNAKNLYDKRITCAFFNAGLGGAPMAFARNGNFRCVSISDDGQQAKAVRDANWLTPAGDGTGEDALKTCQVFVATLPGGDFSRMGKRRGLTGDAANSTLEFMLQVERHRPPVFVAETVTGLLRVNQGADLKRLLGMADKAGYRVTTSELEVSMFGVPSMARRLVITGVRKVIHDNLVLPSGNGIKPPPLSMYLDADVGESYHLSAAYEESLKRRTERNAKKGNGFGMRVLSGNDLASSFCSGGSGRERNLVRATAPTGKSGLRRLTPTECLRVLGFPKGFAMPVSDSAAYRLIGTAAPYPMLEGIADTVAGFVGGRFGMDDMRWRQVRADSELWHAVKDDDLARVGMALAAGGLVTCPESSALSVAASKEMVSFLLAAGADLHARSGVTRSTCLHRAANARVAKCLVTAGADIEARNKDGETPLHRAVMNRRTGIIRTLIALGADLSATRDDGKTPLELATGTWWRKDMTKAIREAEAKVVARKTEWRGKSRQRLSARARL